MNTEHSKEFLDFPKQIRLLADDAFPSKKFLGKQAPLCWAGTWAAIAELYRFATCQDSCPGPSEDHTIPLLVGRIANEALGTMDSLERGYYDHALVCCRVICEQHNLIALLLRDEQALNIFKRGDSPEILRELAPKVVRAKLKQSDAYDAIVKRVDDVQYELNKRAIHPSLEQLTIAHTPGKIVVGPLWQLAGFQLALNELAFAVFAILSRLIIESQVVESNATRAWPAIQQILDGLGRMRVDDLPLELRHNIPIHRWTT